ncbi:MULTISPECIES: hypothetical protein [Bacteroides]|uniref:hypothetical protein n=1 Tax=Bacteroides TaxID=816 RepID=UPI00189CE461|nr:MULTISPECIES: hypothetical protein [Bacteroides]MDC1777321.1 hypothetical protein [Bacteroides uniformis]MDC1778780.1 hypothetical protein [Bacteroides uniformis]
MIASLEHLFPISLSAQFGPQTFLALAFFMSGYLYRKSGLNRRNPQYYEWALRLSMPVVASYFLSLSMPDARSLSWLYYIVALCGTIGFIQFARQMQYGKVVSLFNYIDNKTLYILTFHFLALKLVSYVVIKFEGLPITYLSQFPVLKDVDNWIGRFIQYSVLQCL